MKTCSKCGVTKPLTEYQAHRQGAFGKRPDCKTCCKERKRRTYEQNRDKVLQATREYQKRNPEKVREIHRLANIRRRKDPEWAERQREYNREYGANNRQGRAERQRRRNQKLAACAVNDFTWVQWERLKASYDWRCAYCGEQMTDLQTDHVIPVSHGGNHTVRNIVPSCGPCNLRKATRTDMPFHVIPAFWVS